MLKKILIVLVALWVIGSLLGNDDEAKDIADDTGSDVMAGTGAQEVSPSPTPSPSPGRITSSATGTKKTPARHSARRQLVIRVIDGDTLELDNGEAVRLIGIDAPERGACGYAEATANMERLVLGERVRLRRWDEDRDRYDRLLRYVTVGGIDAGLRQIDRGLAVARYDSRDGYGYHPRENKYIAVDKVTPDLTCIRKPAPQPLAPIPVGGCAEGYEPCIPPYPPDIDCADVAGPINVAGADPHGLDADGDGLACE